MNSISRLLLACGAALTLTVSATAATPRQAKEASQVRNIIDKVNTHWQTTHKPEAWSFWHVAAYHTGNMEAYKLTGKPGYLDYSLAWADHNQWKGG